MKRPTSQTARMEDACSLLAKAQRRYLLYQLAESGAGNVDDVVPQIVAWENGASQERTYDATDADTTDAAVADATDVDEEARQRVYVALVHNHLPRLADYGVLDYDLRSGDIVLTDGFADLESLLEQFRQTEDVPEIRQLSPL